jgi:hypothetical protein
LIWRSCGLPAWTRNREDKHLLVALDPFVFAIFEPNSTKFAPNNSRLPRAGSFVLPSSKALLNAQTALLESKKAKNKHTNEDPIGGTASALAPSDRQPVLNRRHL